MLGKPIAYFFHHVQLIDILLQIVRVNLVVNVLASLGVATGVEVGAVTQGELSVGEGHVHEMKFVARWPVLTSGLRAGISEPILALGNYSVGRKEVARALELSEQA